MKKTECKGQWKNECPEPICHCAFKILERGRNMNTFVEWLKANKVNKRSALSLLIGFIIGFFIGLIF